MKNYYKPSPNNGLSNIVRGHFFIFRADWFSENNQAVVNKTTNNKIERRIYFIKIMNMAHLLVIKHGAK